MIKELNTLDNVKKQDSKNSGKKQLIKKEEIKNSPFTIITIEKESFGVMGEYRVTQKYKTKKEVKEELENITWNRIVQVMLILTETIKKQQ